MLGGRSYFVSFRTHPRYVFTYEPSGQPLPPQDIRLPPTFRTIEVQNWEDIHGVGQTFTISIHFYPFLSVSAVFSGNNGVTIAAYFGLLVSWLASPHQHWRLALMGPLMEWLGSPERTWPNSSTDATGKHEMGNWGLGMFKTSRGLGLSGIPTKWFLKGEGGQKLTICFQRLGWSRWVCFSVSSYIWDDICSKASCWSARALTWVKAAPRELHSAQKKSERWAQKDLAWSMLDGIYHINRIIGQVGFILPAAHRFFFLSWGPGGSKIPWFIRIYQQCLLL